MKSWEMGYTVASDSEWQNKSSNTRVQHKSCFFFLSPKPLSVGSNEKSLHWAEKLFIHIDSWWFWHSCSLTHWWHGTKKRKVKYHQGKVGARRRLASGGRLKSGHLVQLQWIKAVVTKGLGERARACEAPAMHLCAFHRCVHCASSNLN